MAGNPEDQFTACLAFIQEFDPSLGTAIKDAIARTFPEKGAAAPPDAA